MNERPPQQGDGGKEPIKDFSGLAALRTKLEQQGDGAENGGGQRPASLDVLTAQLRQEQERGLIGPRDQMQQGDGLVHSSEQMQQSDNTPVAEPMPEFRSRRVFVQSADSVTPAVEPVVEVAEAAEPVPPEAVPEVAEVADIGANTRTPKTVVVSSDVNVGASLDTQTDPQDTWTAFAVSKGEPYPEKGKDIAAEVRAYTPEYAAQLREQILSGDETFIDNGSQRKPIPFLKEEIKRILQDAAGSDADAVYRTQVEPYIRALSDTYRNRELNHKERQEAIQTAQRELMAVLRQSLRPTESRFVERKSAVASKEESSLEGADNWLTLNTEVSNYLTTLGVQSIPTAELASGSEKYQKINALRVSLLDHLGALNVLQSKLADPDASSNIAEKMKVLVATIKREYTQLREVNTDVPPPATGPALENIESEQISDFESRRRDAIAALVAEGFRESEVKTRFESAFDKYPGDKQLSEDMLRQRLDLVVANIRHLKSGVKRVRKVGNTTVVTPEVVSKTAAPEEPELPEPSVAAPAPVLAETPSVAPIAESAGASAINTALESAKRELAAVGVPESEIDTRIARLIKNAEGDTENKLAPLTVEAIERFTYNVSHDPTGEWNAAASAAAPRVTEKPLTKRDKKSADLEGKDLTRLADRLENQGSSTEDDDIVAREKYRNRLLVEAAARREANPIRSQEELYTDIAVAAEALPIGDPLRAKLESLQQTVADLRESDEKTRVWMLGKYQSKFETLTESHAAAETAVAAPVVEQSSEVDAIAKLGNDLKEFIASPFTSDEEKTTARMLFENSVRQKQEGKDPAATLKSLEDFITNPPSLNDIAARMQRGKAYVEASAFNPESRTRAGELYATYEALVAGDQNDPEYIQKVQSAYEDYGRYVSEVQITPYEASRREWKESFRDHQTKKQAYHDALKQHQDSISRLAKLGKMLGMSPKAFEPTPELQAAEEAYKEARKAYAGRLGNVIKGRREKLHPDAVPFEQSEVVPKLNAAMARKFWMRPRREQVEITAQRLLSPEMRARFERVGGFLHRNRTASWLGQVALYGAIGGATGGLSVALMAGGAKGIRIAGSVLAGYGGARIAQGLTQRGIDRANETVKDTLGTFSVENIDAYEKNYIDAAVGLENKIRTQKIAKVAAASLAGLGAGVGSGVALSGGIPEITMTSADASATVGVGESAIADAMDPGSTGVVEQGAALDALTENAPAPEAQIYSPRAEQFDAGVSGVELNDPVIPNDPTTAVPSLEKPVFSPQAEQIPADSGVEMNEPTEPDAAFTPEQRAPIESVEVPLEHDIRRGENVWQVTSFYGDKLLEGLTDRERNQVLMGLRDTINSNLDLQQAAGITSGDADLIFEGETLKIDPILEALRGEIEKVAPGHLPPVPASEYPLGTPVAVASPALSFPDSVTGGVSPSGSEFGNQSPAPLSFGVLDTDAAAGATDRLPDTPVTEPILVSASPELGKNVLVTDGVVEQVKLAFPSLDAYKDTYGGWVERVQGADPRAAAWGSWFNLNAPSHENAFNFLSTMKLADIDALNVRDAAERTAYLNSHNIRPADFTAWSNKLTEWRADKSITGIQPNATFGSVADKAFTLEHIKKPAGTLV